VSNRYRSQQGASSLSAVLSLLILAAVLFAAFRLAPPYVNNYQLQDAMDNLALQATYSQQMPPEAIRKAVITRAGELGIPLTNEQVAVSKGGGGVSIAVQYTVTVDLLVRRLDLRFTPSVNNRDVLAR